VPAKATRRVVELRLHKQAALVPDMTGEEYAGFVADVGEHGVLSPLEVNSSGVVLDGRQRLRAARELALERVPVRIVKPADELLYIVRAALHRRHLSASQRAALAVELEEFRRAEARRNSGRRRSAEVATLPPQKGRTRELGALLVGVAPRTVQDAATVRDADPELFAQVKAGRIPVHRAAKRVRRERRLRALPPTPRLPRGRFDVIYADPPWRSSVPSSDWAPENHYDTLTAREIQAFKVPAADDAILFLWAVNCFLPEALAVMTAWGFEYRANLAWVKNWIGLGFWVRNRHELLLVGRRGRFPLADAADRPDSVIEAPRGRHSEKPACVYELIERMYPAARRLELFARKARSGWTAWGNEVAT
jgi:N6-adenosine-specific RNA methylase IME4/ParB-like chromosome segregation protein Spo0J